MRPAYRKPSPPNHTPRKGRLAPYDRAGERQAVGNIDRELALAEGMVAISQASLSLTNHIYNEMVRDNTMPDPNPLNVGDAA